VFLAHGIGNTVGGLALAGFSVRYRFDTRRGVTFEELSHLAFSYSVTFWPGLLALGGLSLALDPSPSARELPAPGLVRLAAHRSTSTRSRSKARVRRSSGRLSPASRRTAERSA
jgi:uncharacterized membrane protein YbhN (UPF0104 family)